MQRTFFRPKVRERRSPQAMDALAGTVMTLATLRL